MPNASFEAVLDAFGNASVFAEKLQPKRFRQLIVSRAVDKFGVVLKLNFQAVIKSAASAASLGPRKIPNNP